MYLSKVNYFTIVFSTSETRKGVLIGSIVPIFLFRIKRMARNIHDDICGEPIVILCILKGGYQFCEDLLNFIKRLNANSGMTELKLQRHLFWSISKKNFLFTYL